MKQLLILATFLFLNSCNIDEPDNRRVEIRIRGQLQSVELDRSHFYLRNSQYFTFSYHLGTDVLIWIWKEGNNLIVSKSIRTLSGGYAPQIADTAEIQSYLIYGATLSVTAENSKGTQITLLELR